MKNAKISILPRIVGTDHDDEVSHENEVIDDDSEFIGAESGIHLFTEESALGFRFNYYHYLKKLTHATTVALSIS